jgi:hypothetical protein
VQPMVDSKSAAVKIQQAGLFIFSMLLVLSTFQFSM